MPSANTDLDLGCHMASLYHNELRTIDRYCIKKWFYGSPLDTNLMGLDITGCSQIYSTLYTSGQILARRIVLHQPQLGIFCGAPVVQISRGVVRFWSILIITQCSKLHQAVDELLHVRLRCCINRNDKSNKVVIAHVDNGMVFVSRLLIHIKEYLWKCVIFT